MRSLIHAKLDLSFCISALDNAHNLRTELYGEGHGLICLPNVRDDGSPLASGVTPAREAEAGDMPEVPKAW